MKTYKNKDLVVQAELFKGTPKNVETILALLRGSECNMDLVEFNKKERTLSIPGDSNVMIIVKEKESYVYVTDEGHYDVCEKLEFEKNFKPFDRVENTNNGFTIGDIVGRKLTLPEWVGEMYIQKVGGKINLYNAKGEMLGPNYISSAEDIERDDWGEFKGID